MSKENANSQPDGHFCWSCLDGLPVRLTLLCLVYIFNLLGHFNIYLPITLGGKKMFLWWFLFTVVSVLHLILRNYKCTSEEREAGC